MFNSSEGCVPEGLQTGEFLLRPLRATDVQLDYDAVILQPEPPPTVP